MGGTHGELLDLALRDMRPRRAVDALHGLLHRDAAGVLGHTLSHWQRVQLGREVERAVEREVVDLRGRLGGREAVQVDLAEERLQRTPGVMDHLATAGGEARPIASAARTVTAMQPRPRADLNPKLINQPRERLRGMSSVGNLRLERDGSSVAGILFSSLRGNAVATPPAPSPPIPERNARRVQLLAVLVGLDAIDI
ncbi:MAG: hypothetical protein Q8S73_16625 [Deltaproteobacteria bacterium]|nr:hypothetical protein [Deltaproteobacteria bacterium]